MTRRVFELFFDLAAGAEGADVALNGRWTPFILYADPASTSGLHPALVVRYCFVEIGEMRVDHVATEVPVEAL